MNFLERYYQTTRSPFTELLRYFFGGLFRLESSADEDSYKVWMIQILALLITASWYIPVNLHRRYVELHASLNPEAYRLAYSSDCLNALVLMTLLVALVTVIEWTELFPSRQDHLVLTPLPITRLHFFAAKLAALMLFVTLVIGSMALIAGIALPGIASGVLETRPIAWRMIAFFLASLGTCYFTFWGLLAVQGCLMAVLPVRWFERASFALQLILLVALLCALPLYPYFPAAHLIATHSAWLAWLPPAWYWSWAERMLGAQDGALSRRAELGLVTVLLTASLTYLISYLQYTRYALESSGRGPAKVVDLAAAVARLFELPQSRGTCEFTLRTLARCRRQKLVFMLVFGIGVALVVESSTYMALHPRQMARALESAIIAAPLTLSFFAMLGLRRAFRLPEELRANWLFQLHENPITRESQLDTVLKCFLLLGALPMWMICAPLQFVQFGPRAILVLTAQSALMYTMARYLLWDWRAIPFTVAQNPGRRHFIQSLVVHIIELVAYSFVASEWILKGLRQPIWFALLAGLMLGSLLVLRNLRKGNGHAPLEFAERVPEVVEALHLVAD